MHFIKQIIIVFALVIMGLSIAAMVKVLHLGYSALYDAEGPLATIAAALAFVTIIYLFAVHIDNRSKPRPRPKRWQAGL